MGDRPVYMMDPPLPFGLVQQRMASIIPGLATGNRRDDHQSIIGIDNRIDAVSVADIFLIQIDIHKTAQLLAIIQVLA